MKPDPDIVAVDACRYDYAKRFFDVLCRTHAVPCLEFEQAMRALGRNGTPARLGRDPVCFAGLPRLPQAGKTSAFLDRGEALLYCVAVSRHASPAAFQRFHLSTMQVPP
ncbi:hypothetical protein [Massilia agri]|uniref:Uncharacterized protein n=1 Tax=Massilia agri TaxID=1886785 RepID=A0ABT2AMC9_9BURK|nr:hypothetical protein [Massilia agri]MCS0597320.1 hypothetical protein [Massilia agri]